MCSRYYIDRSVGENLSRLTAQGFSSALTNPPHDVSPGQPAPVLVQRETGLALTEMRWGLETRSGLLINARAETVQQKPAFRGSVLSRRCVIPARSFYEWNECREKVTFSNADGDTIYMAGIYDECREENRFVILTTQANASVAAVHDRMPLILGRDEISPWLCCSDALSDFLQRIPGPLQKMQEYEQLDLFRL